MSVGENDWVPSSCTLPSVEQPLRVAEFDRFFEESVRAVRRVEPSVLELTIPAAAEEQARDLTAREVACCSFFSFDLLPVAEGLVLRIGVPVSTTYRAVLDAVEARAGGQRM
jgi:hypothetical protein